jgi:predicted Zn finger-like uncharacterized protein
MLLTICPNCSAQFKVQPEQLNVRQGRVMCGRCRQVFNAFQSLSRVEEPTEPFVADLQEAVAEHEESVSGDEAVDASADVESKSEPVADALFLREEPMPLSAGFSAFELPQHAASPAPIAEEFPAEASEAANPRGDTGAMEIPPADLHSNITTPVEPAIDLSGDDNPLLDREPSSAETRPAAPSRAWAFGVFILFFGLLAQAGYAFRATLVSTYPPLRPMVSQVCEFAGCKVSWGRDESALKIEYSELIETPGKPGRVLLTATLVNRGETKQDLPSLELRLTDNANQVVASRLLHPSDYLGRALAKDEGLVPNTEFYVNLNLELSNKPVASGYGLIVFYP